MERAIDSIQKALAFAKEKGLELIILSSYESNVHLPKEGDYKVIYNVGPDEWLGYIEQAEYIFTNSFHACAFSILFEKQFYVGARHGDKVDTILKTFDLEDRRFTKPMTVQNQQNRSIIAKLVSFWRKNEKPPVISY